MRKRVKKPAVRYAVTIEWSEEDACFVARVPALKYCAAHGDTYDEALCEIQIAMTGFLAVMAESKTPIPAPDPAILMRKLPRFTAKTRTAAQVFDAVLAQITFGT